MKRIVFFIAVICPTICFSQKDTLSSFDVKLKYDSVLGQNLYYEKVNKNNEDFFDDKNFKIVDNKVIKSGSLYKDVVNGILKKTVEVEKEYTTKTVKLFDSLGQVEYIIKCKNQKIDFVEKYNGNLLELRLHFGLNKMVEEFHYTDKGYNLRVSSKGVTSIYSVTLDFDSGKVLSKIKIGEESNVDIEKDDDGEYYFLSEELSSKIYSEQIECCQ